MILLGSTYIQIEKSYMLTCMHFQWLSSKIANYVTVAIVDCLAVNHAVAIARHSVMHSLG